LFAVFLGRIDRNQDMKIDWVEWRDYFELRSAESVEEILKLWRCPPVRTAGNLVVAENVFICCTSFCIAFCSSRPTCTLRFKGTTPLIFLHDT